MAIHPLLRIPPETAVSLLDFDANHTGGRSKEGARENLKSLAEEIAELQTLLFANATRSLLVVVQGMDASGKNSVVDKVFKEVNHLGLEVAEFKKPTDVELAHDFLWRVHAKTPRKGYIGVFNRSHYEDVLIVKVHKWVSDEAIRQRYEQINAFEKMLTENGTTILKFYLHIDRKEQKKQLQERLDDPTRHWKFNAVDVEERRLWKKYMAAYEGALTHTSTAWAPWHVIPSNHRWFKNQVIAEAVRDALVDMKLEWPPLPKACAGMVID